MTPVDVRKPIHRGSVLASGIAIDTALVGVSEARRRILEFSRLGLRVLRSQESLIGLFRDSVRMDCAAARGTPLVRYGQLLAAAPLEPDEQKQLTAASEAVVLVVGGRAQSRRVDELAPQDIATWLDLSQFLAVTDVVSLGQAVAAPKAAFRERTVDVREALGAADLSEEARTVLRSLQKQTRTAAQSAGRGSIAGALAGLLSGIRRILRSASSASRAAPSQGGRASRGLAVAPDTTHTSGSWLARLGQRISRFAAQLLLSSRLAALIGRRQAEYVARMLEMFDSNQLDDALRHAIPLDSSLEAALRRPMLGTPSPRADLSIAPGGTAATTSLGFGPSLFEGLRQRYRRAFESLAARGEIEKAAFVLAELLGANEEAVAFLERHGNLRLSAEIAEARHLPAGIVIRAWFLAGDRARAIHVARRTGAFGDAVVRLEKTHSSEAQALRLLWADFLATAGAYAAAVDAVWPVTDARGLTLAWVDRAIEVGGSTGARMLARKVLLAPSQFSEIRDRVLRLLDGDPTDGLSLQAFGQELTAGEATPEASALARAAARGLLRSSAERDPDQLIRRLIALSGDAALRADLEACHSAAGRARSEQRKVFVRASAYTQQGNKRGHNEDTILVAFLDETSAAANQPAEVDGDASAKGLALGVFDGMGGMDAGNRASQLAAATVLDWLRAEYDASRNDAAEWAHFLQVSLKAANQRIFEGATANHRQRGMASAATVATLCGDKLLFAQVGDTRGYVLRGNTLTRVTRDHSLLNEWIATKREQGTPPTQQEIDDFPHPNVIIRTLGLTEQTAIDITEVALANGDVVLLCSDGLCGVVEDERIRGILAERKTPYTTHNHLLALAQEAGAPDDIAIVVAMFGGDGLTRSREAITLRPVVPLVRDGHEARRRMPLASRPSPLELQRTAADRGTMPIHDIAELPDGRLLVALGELGVWLVSREGKVQTRFAEPAQRLVISDHGDRALLLAPRGEAFRVARLDLITKRVRPWCVAHFQQFAADFDGTTWFVARSDSAYQIDATAEGWEHLWKVVDTGTPVAGIQRDATNVCFWCTRGATAGEAWLFELPSLTLRKRQSIGDDQALLLAAGISVTGRFAGWSEQQADSKLAAQAWFHDTSRDLPVTTTSLPEPPHVTDRWMAMAVVDAESTTIHLLDTAECKVRMRIQLDGAGRTVAIRFQGEHLVLGDGCGRVLVVSLEDGSVLREFRIS